VENPNYNNLTSMHFYGWSKGLKTGIYYLRRKGRHQAQQFTIEPEKKPVVSEGTNRSLRDVRNFMERTTP
jgi:ribonucleotide reductase alpha subunit